MADFGSSWLILAQSHHGLRSRIEGASCRVAGGPPGRFQELRDPAETLVVHMQFELGGPFLVVGSYLPAFTGIRPFLGG